MKTIALLDSQQGGHHDWYLEVFARALRALDCRVLLFSPSAPSIAEQLGDSHAIGFSWIPPSPPRPALLEWLPGRKHVWDAAHQALLDAEQHLKLNIDLSFFAWMERWLGRGQNRWSIARAFPRTFSGLVFQPWMYRIRGRAPFVRRSLLDPHEPLHSSRCAGIAVLDQKIAQPLSRRIRRPVIPFPDIPCLNCAANSPLAQQLRSAARGRGIVLLTGVIDGRKGVDAFLNAASRSDPDAWVFVLAGPIAWTSLAAHEREQLSLLINQPAQHSFVLTTNPLPEAEINALIRESDLLWLAYENFHYSSNLLSKAAALRVPVWSNGQHVIGEAVRDYSLGFASPTLSLEKWINVNGRAMVNALRTNASYLHGCARYEALHSIPCLENAWRLLMATIPMPSVQRKRASAGT